MRSILWIVILVILYGSLYPFDFVWIDPFEVNWSSWIIQIKQRTTNGDVLSNFLTFLPLGYFAFNSNSSDESRSNWRLVQIVVITSIFALCLQIAQFFLPSRVPAPGDALINTLGTLCGLMVAFFQRRWLINNPQVAVNWPVSYSVPLILVVCWILYQLFPFAIELSTNNLNQSTRELWSFVGIDWANWVFLAVMWYCFLVLLETNPWSNWSLHRTLIVVLSILFGKILIAHNSLTFTELTSVVVAIFAFRLIRHKIAIGPLCGIIFVSIAFKELHPWLTKETVKHLNLIPFRYYLSGSLWENTHLLLERLFIYGVLIYHLKQLTKSIFQASLYTGGLVALIEIAKIFLSEGRATITEFLIVAFVGYVFHQMSRPEMTSIHVTDLKKNTLANSERNYIKNS